MPEAVFNTASEDKRKSMFPSKCSQPPWRNMETKMGATVSLAGSAKRDGRVAGGDQSIEKIKRFKCRPRESSMKKAQKLVTIRSKVNAQKVRRRIGR